MKLYTISIAEPSIGTLTPCTYPSCKIYYVVADSYSSAVARFECQGITSVSLMAAQTSEGIFEQIDWNA